MVGEKIDVKFFGTNIRFEYREKKNWKMVFGVCRWCSAFTAQTCEPVLIIFGMWTIMCVISRYYFFFISLNQNLLPLKKKHKLQFSNNRLNDFDEMLIKTKF